MDSYLTTALEGFLAVAAVAADHPADAQVEQTMRDTLVQLALLLHIRSNLARVPPAEMAG